MEPTAAPSYLSWATLVAVGAFALILFATWRGRRRNLQGRCAHCGKPVDDDPYGRLGQMACTRCSSVGRSVFHVGLVTIVSVGVIGGGLFVGSLLSGVLNGAVSTTWVYMLPVLPLVALGALILWMPDRFGETHAPISPLMPPGDYADHQRMRRVSHIRN